MATIDNNLAQLTVKEFLSEGKYEHVDDVDVDGFGLNGFGVALDLGAEYKINDDWRVSWKTRLIPSR